MSKSEKRRMTGLIGVRCTRWEKGLIEKAAASSGCSVAEFVRDAALKRAHEVVDQIAARDGSEGAA